MANDQTLQNNSDEAGANPGQQNCYRRWNPCMVSEGGYVGADHHQLAMSHVDHAHHAEDEYQPDRREDQESYVVKVLIDVGERVSEIGHSTRWSNFLATL